MEHLFFIFLFFNSTGHDTLYQGLVPVSPDEHLYILALVRVAGEPLGGAGHPAPANGSENNRYRRIANALPPFCQETPTAGFKLAGRLWRLAAAATHSARRLERGPWWFSKQVCQQILVRMTIC